MSFGCAALALALGVPLVPEGEDAEGERASDVARVTTVQAPSNAVVRRAFLDDLDVDGRSDLLVLMTRGERRVLSVHFGKEGGAARFAPAADLELELTPDVVALAPGDVHAAAGREIVLWSARGAFAWLPRAADREKRFARLGALELLWQLADPEDVVLWRSGVRDLDGDGLDDLCTPEPGGYRIHLQRRGSSGAEFTVVEHHALDPALLVVDERRAVRTSDDPDDETDADLAISFGDEGLGISTAGTLLSIEDRLAAPQLFDWDADGDLDLLAATPSELLVWQRGTDGEEPGQSLKLPVEVDRVRRLDVSFGAALSELDGDARVDCVVFAGDKRSADVRTQVLVFTQAGAAAAGGAEAPPLFGAEGRPQQLLVLAGFGGDGRLEDVDGDGRRDLVVTAIRPDLLGALAGGGGDSIELELDVFRNQGGRFSQRPDLSTRLQVEPDSIGSAARFAEDAGGDGVRDLIVREHERLALYLVRRARGGGGLERLPRAAWEIPLDEDADVLVEELPSGRRELLIVTEREVLHVEIGAR